MNIDPPKKKSEYTLVHRNRPSTQRNRFNILTSLSSVIAPFLCVRQWSRLYITRKLLTAGRQQYKNPLNISHRNSNNYIVIILIQQLCVSCKKALRFMVVELIIKKKKRKLTKFV